MRRTQFFRCSHKKPDNEDNGTAKEKTRRKSFIGKMCCLAHKLVPSYRVMDIDTRVARNEIMKTKRGPTWITMLLLAGAQTENANGDRKKQKKNTCKLRLMGKVLRYDERVSAAMEYYTISFTSSRIYFTINGLLLCISFPSTEGGSDVRPPAAQVYCQSGNLLIYSNYLSLHSHKFY